MTTAQSLALLIPFGAQEIFLILLIVVVLFGATRIPQLGKALGEGIKNFKQGIRDGDAEKPEEPTTKPPASS
jgi:sec-independent protein translocase protein TatA